MLAWALVAAAASAASTRRDSSGSGDDRFGWIAAIERDGGTHQLEARTYAIDRQYLLRPGTVLLGAGSGSSVAKTTILAVPTKPAQVGATRLGCGANHVNRQGFVLSSRVHIGRFHYIGFDTHRFNDSHPLCGGAPLETPGCSTAFCIGANSSSNASVIFGGEGVRDILVTDVSVANGTTQNGFWMPETRSVPCENVTVRGLVTSGTWADGVNIHGAHKNIRVEDCSVSHSGDDAYAIWSEQSGDSGIRFHNNTATSPRYPGATNAGCFVAYGGNRSEFVNNRCSYENDTGHVGMISFRGGFGGAFSPDASSLVANNSVNRGRPICGGAVKAVGDPPGCALPPATAKTRLKSDDSAWMDPFSFGKAAAPGLEWFKDAKLGLFMHWGPVSHFLRVSIDSACKTVLALPRPTAAPTAALALQRHHC